MNSGHSFLHIPYRYKEHQPNVVSYSICGAIQGPIGLIGEVNCLIYTFGLSVETIHLILERVHGLVLLSKNFLE